MMVFSEDNSPGRFLTHVGVGVSQVLPIVVMCLMAEKGSIILLEQPELHLHPKGPVAPGGLHTISGADGQAVHSRNAWRAPAQPTPGANSGSPGRRTLSKLTRDLLREQRE